MIRKSVAEILDHHVTFELEAIDRMYLNGYVPSLQSGGGVVYFMKTAPRRPRPVDHDGGAPQRAVRERRSSASSRRKASIW